MNNRLWQVEVFEPAAHSRFRIFTFVTKEAAQRCYDHFEKANTGRYKTTLWPTISDDDRFPTPPSANAP